MGDCTRVLKQFRYNLKNWPYGMMLHTKNSRGPHFDESQDYMSETAMSQCGDTVGRTPYAKTYFKL